MSGHTDRVDRFAVQWRVDADPGAAGHARLSTLTRSLIEYGLAGGLSTGADRDELVCVRRVRVPPVRMRWDGDDAELAARWGRLAGPAVSDALAAGGADVVRYRTAAHARQHLVTGVLREDRAGVWAWRLLGLWPAAGPAAADDAPATEVLAHVLLTAAGDEPHAAVAMMTAVAAAGLLPRMLAVVPDTVLAVLVGAAWRRTTGSVAVLEHPSGDPADAVSPGAGAVVARSAVIRALRNRPEREAAPDHLSAATALAALAVLEVDPGLARGPSAGRLVAELADRIAGGRAARPDRPDSPAPDHRDATRDHRDATRPAPPGTAPDPPKPSLPARSAARRQPGSDPEPPIDAGRPLPAQDQAEARYARVCRTRWGGLLFLLPLVDEAGLPDAVAADPGRFGAELRPVLHELGRRICRRAAPGTGLADATDPAVLAFAGLPPYAGPPEIPPRADALEAFVGDLTDLLRARLRAPALGDEAVLATVCHRNAVIEAEPGWIDVRLSLDDVDLDVRRAGLDLDPDFLPWLGCVVRYRYG
jgi:hypothetical protein